MSSKGITPVIATVLLILVSIAATGAAFTFLIDIQEQTQENYENKFDDQELETKSSIGIEFMYNKSHNLYLSVRNTGSITIPVKENKEHLWDLYIDGTPLNGDSKSWNLTGDKKDAETVTIDAQETVTINTTVMFPAEGEDTAVEIAGPYSISASSVCYNSGAGTC